MNQSVNAAHKEVNKLKAKLDDSKDEIQELNEIIVQIEESMVIKENINCGVEDQEEINQLKAENKDLKALTKVLNKDIEECRGELIEAEKTIELLTEENASLKKINQLLQG
ncbi:hypothetical protein PIROE2DRAFT_4943 [Piromyces sp. E2]|nr:hypothetical protein PIROE2DRAFT_4943 [Piromyces sp. E2]|eukprot:OUM67541.1 hypothetical protein PIROE2DRAFT_4943 [Piromyces sp. E2]